MTQKIYSLIPKIGLEIGAIGKGGRNSAQNYAFRGIEQMFNEIQPVMAKAGVFVVPQVQTVRSQAYDRGEGKHTFRVELTVAHHFFAEDGSFVTVTTQGEGIDTSDKASNKAMSAAMKYAFIELFSIPTQDIADSDRDSPDVPSKAKAVTEALTKGDANGFF